MYLLLRPAMILSLALCVELIPLIFLRNSVSYLPWKAFLTEDKLYEECTMSLLHWEIVRGSTLKLANILEFAKVGIE